MHTSKAILENVIFCHQEEINWPFSEPANLKKVFDEIFDTAKYSKSIEYLKDINKEYTNKTKEKKVKLELFQKDYEQYQKIADSHKNTLETIKNINDTVRELKEKIFEEENNLQLILNQEENTKIKENDINLLKLKIEENYRLIQLIKGDPFFQDLTESEENFQNLIKNFDSNIQDNSSKINQLKGKLQNLQERRLNLSNEKYALEISINSAKDNLKKNLNYFTDLLRLLRIPDVDIKITFDSLFILKKKSIYEIIEENNLHVIRNKKEIIFNNNCNTNKNYLNNINNSNYHNNLLEIGDETKTEAKFNLELIEEIKNLGENNLESLIADNIENLNIIPFGLWDRIFVDKNNNFTNLAYINDLELLDRCIDFDYLKKSILEKIKEIKHKYTEIDSRKKLFENKLSEKTNESEFKNMVLENKNKEIQILQTRLLEYKMNLKNSENVQISINNYNNQKHNLQENINIINNEIINTDNQLEKSSLDKIELEEKLIKLKLPNSFISDYAISNYNLKNLEKNFNELIKKNTEVNCILNDASKFLGVNKIENLCKLIYLAHEKKEEILESRTQIRESSFSIGKTIEKINFQLYEKRISLENNKRQKAELISNNEFCDNLKKLKINSENLTDNEIISTLDCINELQKTLQLMNEDLVFKKNEIKLNEKNLQKIIQNKKCGFCLMQIDKEKLVDSTLDKNDNFFNIVEKIKNNVLALINSLEKDEEKINQKTSLLNDMKAVSLIINEIKNLNEKNKKIENEVFFLEKEKNSLSIEIRDFANKSKDKSNSIFYVEKFLGENIYKLKNLQDELYRNIYISLNELNYNFHLDKVQILNESSENKEKSENTKNFEKISFSISQFKLNDLCKINDQNINKMDIDSIIMDDKLEHILDSNNNSMENLKSNFDDFYKNSIYLFIEENKKISIEYMEINENLRSLDNKIKEKTEKKSLLLKNLNIANNEIRKFDIYISKLNREGNADISIKIEEIENELHLKNEEKAEILIDMNKSAEIKKNLKEKKEEFEKIYYEKIKKYDNLISNLEKLKMQFELFFKNLPNENFIQYFKVEILKFICGIKIKEKTHNTIEEEINSLKANLHALEKEHENSSVKQTIIKNNKKLYELKLLIKNLKEEIENKNIDCLASADILETKKTKKQKLNDLNNNYNINLGKLYELNNNKNKFEQDMRNENYFEIENRYNKTKMEYISSIETSKYIDT